jgi:hypothetical protein
MRYVGIAGALMLLAASVTPAQVRAEDAPGAWSGSVTPYLWVPSIKGTLRYSPPPDGGSAEVGVDSGPNAYLTNLKFALMLAGEVRKDRFSFFSDLIYLDVGGENSSVRSVDFGRGRIAVDALNTNTRTKLNGLAASALAGYALASGAAADAFAGVRYFELKAETGWQLSADVPGPAGTRTFERSGSVSERKGLWDAVMGVRGRLPLADGRWAIPYYIDIGTGSSRLTWQAMSGVSYLFGWGDVALFYRHLSYEQTGNKLVSELKLDGFGLAATFRF